MEAARAKGLAMRCPVKKEAAKAANLFNEYYMHLTGEKHVTENLISKTWDFPNFNLEEDARVIVNENNDWLGYIAVWNDTSPHVQNFLVQRYKPEVMGTSIQVRLLEWAENKSQKNISKAPDDAEIYVASTMYSTESEQIKLLKEKDYSEVRYFWRMGIDLNQDLEIPNIPDGIRIETHEKRNNLLDIINCDRDSFADHWGYTKCPLDEEIAEWEHWVKMEPYYDPRFWFLACYGNEMAGMSLCMNGMVNDERIGYLDSVCIRKEYRKKGIASALLKYSFLELKKAGKYKAYLHVDADSLTGATKLYESVGMSVNQSSTKMEKIIRKGKSYRTENL